MPRAKRFEGESQVTQERYIVGIAHPGSMGAAIGGTLVAAGHEVLCALEGRSPVTCRRASERGLDDVRDISALVNRCDVVLSVCPPSVANHVAESFREFEGIFVDANAVSSATARTVGTTIDRFVDGSIIGPPPMQSGTTRLYLSGAEASIVAQLFERTAVEARVIGDEPGQASALKMAHAGWTKGTIALLLACRALARAENVEAPLVSEWAESFPDLSAHAIAAAQAAADNGWRWVAEMEEIAASMATVAKFNGFHLAAAELFRTFPQGGTDPLEAFLERLGSSPSSPDSGEADH